MNTAPYSNKYGRGHPKRNKRWKPKTKPHSVRFSLPPALTSPLEKEQDKSPLNHGKQKSSCPVPDAEFPSQTSTGSADNVTCENCTSKAELKETSESHDSLLTSDLSAAVISVVVNLQRAKERRSKQYFAEAVEGVLERITSAFEHYGMDFSISSDKDDIWHDSTSLSLGDIDIQQEVETMQERHSINEVFSSFETRCASRNEIFKDIDRWISRAKDALNECAPEEDISEILEEHTESLAVINRAFSQARANTSKLAMLINRALRRNDGVQGLHQEVTPTQEKSPEVDEENSSANGDVQSDASKQQKPFYIRKVFTEKDLSAYPTNAKVAANYLNDVLEEGARNVTNTKTKAILKSGIRQFKTLWEFAEKKLEDVSVLEEKTRQQSEEVTRSEEQRTKDQELLKVLKEENLALHENNEQLQQQIAKVVDQLNCDNASKRVSFMGVATKERERESCTDAVTSTAPPPVQVLTQPAQVAVETVQAITQGSYPLLAATQQASLFPSNRRSQLMGSQIITGPPQSYHSVNVAPSYSSKSTRNIAVEDIDECETLVQQAGSVRLCCVAGENEAVKALEMQVSLLTEKLFEAEDLISEQQRKMEMLQEGQKVELPPLPKFQLSSHQAFKKRSSIRGSIDVSGLIMMQRKFEQLESESRAVKEELVTKESELQAQLELVDRLRIEMQQLADDKANLEEQHAKDLFKVDKENLTQKQVVMRMKNEFQNELQRLRGHMQREQQRYQAELRKSQIEQKAFTTNINKENLMIMRALGRFKDATVNLLKREGLHDEASEMLMVANPPLEIYANCEDATMILTALSTSAKEILVHVQSQLSRAMLNKRLAIRDVTVAKQNFQRELAESLDKLQKAKTDSVVQEQHLSILEDRNTNLVARYKKIFQTNQLLEKEMKPYKDALEKYQSLKLEMQKLQRECRESAKENANQIRELDRERTSLKKSVLEHQSSLRYLESKAKANKTEQEAKFSRCYISKQDRVRNTNMLASARKTSDISEELYQKGMTALSETSEIAQQRLAHLARSYTAFANMNKMRAVVSRAASRSGERELKFRKYLHEMEERYYKKAMEWEEKRGELVRQREEAFAQLLEVLTTAKDTNDVFHVEPTNKLSVSRNVSTITNNAITSWRDTRPVKKPRSSELPPIVTGRCVTVDSQKRSFWQMPTSVPNKHVQIDTPSIVDMDVNRWKRLVKDYKPGGVKFFKVGNLRLPHIATLYP